MNTQVNKLCCTHLYASFVAENLTDSGRTAGGDRKELGGSKQEGRCGWVNLITVMIGFN